MSTSTRNEPNDRDSTRRSARGGTAQGKVQGKAKAVVHCRLCSETIVLESNFRATPATCPKCGLKFVFDPQEEPLPVRGMRLRTSEVVEAQRRGTSSSYRRHDAHRPAPLVLPPPARTNYLAWAGAIALTLASLMTFFGWLRR